MIYLDKTVKKTVGIKGMKILFVNLELYLSYIFIVQNQKCMPHLSLSINTTQAAALRHFVIAEN